MTDPNISSRPLLPVVAGPTASGKSACAVALCRLIGGEVVSADSMQVYRGMELLSAVPDGVERGGIPHHLLAFVSPDTRYTADAYRADARACIAGIRARGRMPVLCGGTGLYINAVTRPMSFSEQSDPVMHEELMAMGVTPEGRRALHAQLEKVDPESATRLHENDVRRVARAIEIFRLTGITQSEQIRRDKARPGEYHEIIFAPDWPREILYRRIDQRVDAMVSRGLVEEVRALMADPQGHPTAMQAIGYKEIATALLGEMPMEKAIEWMKRATRNFAKRQLTWFRHDNRVIWLPAEGRTADDLAEEMRDRLAALSYSNHQI